MKVPVVLCSPLRPGMISEVVARLYFGAPRGGTIRGTTAAPEPLLPPADGALRGAAAEQRDDDEGAAFQIPYESNLND